MSNNKHTKVIVGMSGGVDSSVAAYLLKKQGFQVSGLFMKNWEEDDTDEYCASAIDLADTKAVCDLLNITLHTVNFSDEYWNKVFKIFLTAYQNGITPNPDILCNKEIKFKAFLEFANNHLNADYIATGHYAQIRSNKISNLKQLFRGTDPNKDQSYFLYTLNQLQLSKSLFPLGMLEKKQVRNIAELLNMSTAKKKDSTGLCFIGKRKFRDFITRYLPMKPGKIMTINGDEIGQHQGLMYYTLGQRKGLGIGGTKNGGTDPWYVAEKDIKNNILIVVQSKNNPHLYSQGLIAKQLYWIDHKIVIKTFRCVVKTRYRQPDIDCIVIPINNDRVVVRFVTPVIAITPGQSAVFYKDKLCLGGGIIEQRII
ncbi:tRNA-specific 2-thiouridylase MnmA [Candidatus Profftia lariciata]|uniref:tRNA 2-thiouridine(34) synthase MnmA n=1 Tax=Candidatus Profftia lariciata TaxID=1987921 RepID=UPI001D02BEC1|nr:tRNA 2-thiouridine(34) synthase MnmA [Candidatus Profftia lariciata]UDG81754.1 tRNA-specific 2-thiouridylase MnmA [Candidatus Profftia lariciata]